MRVLFCGTPDFAATILAGIAGGRHPAVGLVSRAAKPQGRGLQVVDPPAVVLARSRGIPVFQTAKLHSEETIERFRALRPDLLVTAAFGRILRPPLLELAPRGAWNVHASLLPRHRGASPVAASILCGDAWTGITIFRLDEGVDTGPMLSQEMTAIGPEETAGELTDRLARLGARMLAEALDREEAGSLPARPQPAWGATYAPLLGKDDGRIDWNRPVEQVERQVRALTPWPGAFTFAAGKRLRVHQARPVHRLDLAATGSPAGAIVPFPGAVGVVCNPGLIELLEVQAEGRARQGAADWLRGSRLAADAVLDFPR
jgi:methionyl-tRNA formyltransferase